MAVGVGLTGRSFRLGFTNSCPFGLHEWVHSPTMTFQFSPPTDPDLRHSRIRLLRLQFRYLTYPFRYSLLFRCDLFPAQRPFRLSLQRFCILVAPSLLRVPRVGSPDLSVL
jgi:hypothetical protein